MKFMVKLTFSQASLLYYFHVCFHFYFIKSIIKVARNIFWNFFN